MDGERDLIYSAGCEALPRLQIHLSPVVPQ